MPLWQWIVDSIGVLLLAVLVYGAALVVRRRVIARGGNTFELSHRARSDRTGRGWVLGLGRYSEDQLEFFRIFSLAPWPMHVLRRDEIVVEGQRLPEGAEVAALFVDHVIVVCRTASGQRELAMASGAMTGFLAWVEAAPPGRPRQP